MRLYLQDFLASHSLTVSRAFLRPSPGTKSNSGLCYATSAALWLADWAWPGLWLADWAWHWSRSGHRDIRHQTPQHLCLLCVSGQEPRLTPNSFISIYFSKSNKTWRNHFWHQHLSLSRNDCWLQHPCHVSCLAVIRSCVWPAPVLIQTSNKTELRINSDQHLQTMNQFWENIKWNVSLNCQLFPALSRFLSLFVKLSIKAKSANRHGLGWLTQWLQASLSLRIWAGKCSLFW